jgi:hypothetical protein
MLVSVIPAGNLLVPISLLRMRPDLLQPWSPVNRPNRKREAIDLIVDRQLHRRIDVAFLLIAAYMYVAVILAAVCQPMDQPWIAMEIEDDRFIGSK